MATRWNTDGSRSIVAPANGKDFSLEEMQEIVGGYIELVTLDPDTTMVVNEDGHAKGLPFNEMATALYLQMANRNGHDTNHPVVGNVLVCSRKEAGYDGI